MSRMLRETVVSAVVLTLVGSLAALSAGGSDEQGPDPAIAFMAYGPSGQTDLMVMAGDGSHERVLLAAADTESIPSAHRWPHWSPDGDWIVFASQMPIVPAGHSELNATGPGLYLIGADGSRLCQIAPLHSIYNPHPAWSPVPPRGWSGTMILYADVVEDRPCGAGFCGQWDLFLTEAVCGAVPLNLTTTPNRDELYVTWSPDAGQIAASVRDLRENQRERPAEIAVFELTGTTLTEVAHPGRPAGCRAAILPDWSRHGERIAACCVGCVSGSVWLYSLADGAWTRLSRRGQTGMHPTWSPDDSHVVFDDERDPALSVSAIEVCAPSLPLAAPSAESAVHYLAPDWRRSR